MPQVRIRRGAQSEELQETVGLRTADLAEHLVGIKASHGSELRRGGARMGQPVRPYAKLIRGRKPDKRPAGGVKHRRTVRHPGDHGEPQAWPQVGVDDARAPFDLPVGANPAQREFPLVSPWAPSWPRSTETWKRAS